MQFEDAQLVYLCLRGDTDAFGRLVERYQGAVYATAYYYVGRYGAAEDVAQEAFLQAYRGLRKLNDPQRFAPWLKEVACRTAANWLRRHAKRLECETPLPHRRTISIEDARQGPDKAVERAERYERVQRAVDALPERHRLPVILRYLQELSYEEISDFTGESEEEIRGVLQRAGRQLRDLIANPIQKAEGNVKWPHAHE